MFSLSIKRIIGMFIILNVAQWSNASVTFTMNNKTVTYPTFDSFENDYGHYEVTGIVVNPTFSTEEPCKLIPTNKTKVFRNPIAADGSLTFNQMIVALDEIDGRESKCETVTQIALEVLAYSRVLRQQYGYPPIKAFLYLIRDNYRGIEGGPFTLIYTSHKSSIPDSQPPIPTALLEKRYYEDFANAFDKNPDFFKATLIQEPGPWNEYFLSYDYRAAIILFTILNVALLFYGFYRLLMLIFNGDFIWEQRNIIFLFSLVSSILTTIAIHMRIVAMKAYVLFHISSILYCITFYLLLLAWYPIIRAVEKNRRFPFRFGISICFGIQLLLSIMKLSVTFMPIGDTNANMDITLSYAMPLIQFIAVIIFIYNAITFKRHTLKWIGNKGTLRALRKLFRISITCALGFLIQSVCNVLAALDSEVAGPNVVAAWSLTRCTAFVLRSYTLLLVVGIPSRGSSTSEEDPDTFKFVKRIFPADEVRSDEMIATPAPSDNSMQSMQNGVETRQFTICRSSNTHGLNNNGYSQASQINTR
ncbi:hypothetical protein BDF19DRAFT_167455 [Syncephalis fuscata]|nr:hypothetical protein BDF19DRAFT_167455 [Syncephalis fuscata]